MSRLTLATLLGAIILYHNSAVRAANPSTHPSAAACTMDILALLGIVHTSAFLERSGHLRVELSRQLLGSGELCEAITAEDAI